MNNHQEILEDIASDVSSRAAAKSKNDNFGSIILIVMLIGIIINLVRVVQECNNKNTKKLNHNEKLQYDANSIKELCSKRGWFTKMKIKKSIRQAIGYNNYKEYGQVLLESIMDSGENITEDKLLKLVEI